VLDYFKPGCNVGNIMIDIPATITMTATITHWLHVGLRCTETSGDLTEAAEKCQWDSNSC